MGGHDLELLLVTAASMVLAVPVVLGLGSWVWPLSPSRMVGAKGVREIEPTEGRVRVIGLGGLGLGGTRAVVSVGVGEKDGAGAAD